MSSLYSRSIARSIAGAIALAACFAGVSDLLAAAPPQPNILFIIADDASCHFG